MMFALGLVTTPGPVGAMEDLIVLCPGNEVDAGVLTPLPEGWWNTPQLGRIAGAEVRQVGGEPVLTCRYRANGNEITVMRHPPKDAPSCRPRLSGFSFICRAEAVESAAGELQGKICQASIQDQVEWDYKGSVRWARKNLESICNNANDSLQPGVCFNRVMHGNINHGNGTRWKWRYALRLCAGTRDANSTIGCFVEEINQQTPWPQAIDKCRASS